CLLFLFIPHPSALIPAFHRLRGRLIAPVSESNTLVSLAATRPVVSATCVRPDLAPAPAFGAALAGCTSTAAACATTAPAGRTRSATTFARAACDAARAAAFRAALRTAFTASLRGRALLACAALAGRAFWTTLAGRARFWSRPCRLHLHRRRVRHHLARRPHPKRHDLCPRRVRRRPCRRVSRRPSHCLYRQPSRACASCLRRSCRPCVLDHSCRPRPCGQRRQPCRFWLRHASLHLRPRRPH